MNSSPNSASLPASSVQQIQRALRNGKLTLFYLLMTIVILRGTIGADKFNTPEKDYEIRHRLHPHRSLPHCSLVEENPSTQEKFSLDGSSDDNDPPPDPSKRYTLGPKISNWDFQRSRWHRSYPAFPPFLTPTKPRVLLVTRSSPKPCENPVGWRRSKRRRGGGWSRTTGGGATAGLGKKKKKIGN